MNLTSRKILGFFIFLVSTGAAEAAKPVAAPFLATNPSVRLAALGGDQVAASGHVDSLFSNPATLTQLSMPELWMTHQQSFLNTSYDTLGFGLPFLHQGLGAGLQYVNDGSFERTDIDGSNQPVLTGDTIRPYSALVHLGWAGHFTDTLSAGFSVKSWTEKLDAKSTQGLALDAGILTHVGIPNLEFGAAVRNLGPDVNGAPLPTLSALGLCFRPMAQRFSDISLLAQYEGGRGGREALRSGVEYNANLVTLRAGYEQPTGSLKSASAGLSLGASLAYKGWSLSYAWKQNDDLDQTQLVSLTVGLGTTPEEKKEVARKVDEAMERRTQEKAAAYFQAGQKAFSEEKWDVAVEQLTLATSWDAHNLDAYNLLRSAEEKQKSVLKEQLSRNPEAGTDEQRSIDAGVDAYIKGDFAQALASWEQVPTTSTAWPTLQGYISKAKQKQLDADLTSRPSYIIEKQVETLSQNAYTHYALGQYDEALSTWKKVLVLDPTNADAQWAIGEVERKKNADGLLTAQQKQQVEALHVQALQAYGKGQLQESLSIWKQALALDPRNLRIKANIQRVENELALKNQ